jgi:hypothetical protein
MIFLDFEAASFTSHPIEVAWVSHDLLRGWSSLIQPIPAWTDWSPLAESQHGITREMAAGGCPPAHVMARLNADLADEQAISDQPEFDRPWLDMLSNGAGIAPSFDISDVPLDALLVSDAYVQHLRGCDSDAIVRAMCNRAGLLHHRALDDCIRHAFRLAVTAAMQMEQDRGADVADLFLTTMIERARELTIKHGRRRDPEDELSRAIEKLLTGGGTFK